MCDRKACRVAYAMFMDNFNCAESVIAGIASELEVGSEVIPKIASGFGGGFSKHGEICGALSGAVMGLGLKYGRTTPDEEAKANLYNMVGRLWTEFEKEFGTTKCKELIGCDMMTEEGMREFKSKDIHHNVCHRFVTWCTERAMAYLEPST